MTDEQWPPDNINDIPPGTRWCFWINPLGEIPGEGFPPSMVYENVSGHWPLNYTWGNSLAEARLVADAENARMGLTKDDVLAITASSFAQHETEKRLPPRKKD